MNYSEEFKQAIRSFGSIPPDMFVPGKIHRIPGIGKHKGNTDAWCLFFEDGLGGVFGDYPSGRQETWQGARDKPWTPEEKQKFMRRAEESKRQAETERKEKADRTAKQSSIIWRNAKPCTTHAYCIKKNIEPYPAREISARVDECKNWFWTTNDDGELIELKGNLLLLRLFNINGELRGLQAIDESGKKSLIKGLSKKGLFISITNEKLPADYKGKLYVGEGFSTTKTVRQATNDLTVAAIDAVNLLHVAQALRKKYPQAEITIAGDLDKNGTGQEKAIKAALAVNGFVAIPPFTESELVGDHPPSDWNDFCSLHGLEATSLALISTKRKAGVPGVASVQTSNGADLSGTPTKTDGVPGVLVTLPTEENCPCFRVFDSEVMLADKSKLRPGVYYFGKKEAKEGAAFLTKQWICSPLYIDAVTFDSQDNNFGRLLRFKPTKGKWRTWAMPMELLSGSGEGLRAELLAMGVSIDPNSQRLLGQYLQDKTPKESMRCALQVGWCGDSFVLPDVVIGKQSSKVIFQSGERGHEEFSCGGTLEGWKENISALAIGNPTLTNALSSSFVGAILKKCNAESGGIHYSGESSTGKTTLIKAACSTWGGSAYSRSWRATANGMEAVASLFNDGLLALDEISEANPKEIGQIIYCLGNGTGKQCASRTGNARSVTRWCCMIMSSGERSIETAMQEGGHKVMAGQSMRLLDIPMTGRFGAWDNLHSFSSGAAFSDAIRQSAATHYGRAGRAFLEKLTRDDRDFGECLERFRALPEFSIEDGEGQDKRAASRFALLAFAGSLATEYGITGWTAEAAIKAAESGLKAWQSLRGKGNSEKKNIMIEITSFIEKHGDSRFSDADNKDYIVRNNRAGYWRGEGKERVYLFNVAGLREALTRFNFKPALDFLQKEGVIPPSSGAKSKSFTLCGQKGRFYSIQVGKLWGNNEN